MKIIQDFHVGDYINNWRIVNVHPPKKKGCGWKYDIICTDCMKTMRTNLNPCILKNSQMSKRCNSCAVIKRNIANRTVQINKSMVY